MEKLKIERNQSKIYRIKQPTIKFLDGFAVPCRFWWTGLTPHPGHEFILRGHGDPGASLFGQLIDEGKNMKVLLHL